MKYRFGEDIIDEEAFVALLGNAIVMKDGSKHCVDDATADAVRKGFMPYPPFEPPQGTRGKAEGKTPSSSSLSQRQRSPSARASKARARLPHHSS